MEVDTNEPRKICPPGSRHGPAGRFGPVHPRLCRAGRRQLHRHPVDRDPPPTSASQSVSDNDSPVPVDPDVRQRGGLRSSIRMPTARSTAPPSPLWPLRRRTTPASMREATRCGSVRARVPTTAFSVPSMTETGSPSPARPTAGTRFSAMGAPAMFRPSLWLSRTTTRLPSPMATGVTSLPTRWDRKS